MYTRNIIKFGVVVSALLLCLLPTPTLAGNLNPTGPPGPTMKTLDQVEARIPISQTDIPLTITSSGSYYLTENITSTTATAITASVVDVTIDLNGFSITGPGSAYSGISGTQRTLVRSGSIKGFRNGMSVGDFSIVEDLVVSGCSELGMYVGPNGRVTSCIANNNGNSGIQVGSGSLVNSCVSSYNSTYGIMADKSCLIENNVTMNNYSGIYCWSGVITNNVSTNNSENGIFTYGALIYANMLTGNGTSAISCNGSCATTNNLQ